MYCLMVVSSKPQKTSLQIGLRIAEMHANELYRRNNDGSLPDWKLEESDSLEYRWQRYEDPAPGTLKHRGRDVRYYTVIQRNYDGGKGSLRN